MTDLLPAELSAAHIAVLLLVVLLLAWAIVRKRRRSDRSLNGVLKKIAYDQVENLIIPNVDGGEIQIDFLALTAQGLLIIDVKEVEGAVFGSDKMQDWTVISDNRRFTFQNPQPALHDRVAAVRQIVRQVPVEGRIVFLDGARFNKGIPAMVCGIDELQLDFDEQNEAAASVKIEAFKPHWELVKQRAVATSTGARRVAASRV